MVEAYLESYENWKEDVNNKYFPPKRVEEIITSRYAYDIIGKSEENSPIYLLKIGKGDTKILCWAQMHGNESTASRAMLDVWKVLHKNNDFTNNLLDKIEIHFIPQLNPDGAAKYTRLNANQMDINRDFNACKTREMKVLKDLVEQENYDFLFNLHDQRTIFHPKGSNKPATISFLAPVVDSEGSVPSNRYKAMQLICSIVKRLNPKLPHQIARFSDEYYPEATGDNFQKLGYSTILIECGHFPQDYERNITRKFTFYSLLLAFEKIGDESYLNEDINYYQELPENDDKALDIIYRNVRTKSRNQFQDVDLGIQYNEVLENNKIQYEAKIHLVGDLSNFIGHDICHAENRLFKNISGNKPEIGNSADFCLDDWKIINGRIVDK